MRIVHNLHVPYYLSKSCVEQCLKALVFMLVTRLAFTKFACKQV